MAFLCRNVKLRYRLVLKRALSTDIFFLKNKLIIIFIHQCQKLLFVMFRCVQIFDSFLLAIMMHQTYPCHLKSLIMLEHFRLFIEIEKSGDIRRILVICNEHFLSNLLNYASRIRQSNELINLKRLQYYMPL